MLFWRRANFYCFYFKIDLRLNLFPCSPTPDALIRLNMIFSVDFVIYFAFFFRSLFCLSTFIEYCSFVYFVMRNNIVLPFHFVYILFQTLSWCFCVFFFALSRHRHCYRSHHQKWGYWATRRKKKWRGTNHIAFVNHFFLHAKDNKMSQKSTNAIGVKVK